ncbi:MAG: phosphoglycerate dehydrogenase [Bryobacterales bacterium]|nr:phosphoglycerate dehydrogenase [Bryobacterales bacterium]
MKILVAEPLAAAGIELLKAQPGWDVVVSDPKGYAEHLAECDALLVRSAVKVNKDVLAKAPRLKVIGRAGVGVDNVDLNAATAAGVLVMNTPGGNAVSVAEHTLGLMLAMARSIPQASASTKAGKWEKKKFLGNELRGKTLGVMGLGSIGREVVKRARAFEMKIVATDPYVNSITAAELGVKLTSREDLYAQSDYITLHVALTTQTQGMLNDAAFEKMKKGVRVVNCARGELIDGEALCRAMQSGKVAGAALDVFQTEPPAAGEPLLAFDTLVATPHIGGSTEEAQEIVGVRIVEQLVDYLQHGVALNAVNVPAMTAEQYRAVGPYIELAERLGVFAANISKGNPSSVRLVYQGKIAEQNTILVRNSGLAGVLSRSLARKANVVNALQFAADRGLGYAEVHEKRASHIDSVRLELTTDAGTTRVEGALVLDAPRLLSVDGIHCEAPLAGHMLYSRNADVPGVIGYVGTVLGKNGINVANFSLGRQDSAPKDGAVREAIAMIETDTAVPEPVLQQLLENKAVKVARVVEFKA